MRRPHDEDQAFTKLISQEDLRELDREVAAIWPKRTFSQRFPHIDQALFSFFGFMAPLGAIYGAIAPPEVLNSTAVPTTRGK